MRKEDRILQLENSLSVAEPSEVGNILSELYKLLKK